MEHTRKFSIDVNSRAKGNTIPASISSEQPVSRPNGLEVLVHTEDAIDLSRVPLPLLVSHDGSQLNIGLVENLKIVGRKLRGVIRFGTRKEAAEVWTDVKAGILKYLSVGYRVIETEQKKGGYLVTKWQPLECSIVSVPADATVGFNRQKQTFRSEKRKKMEYSRENFAKILNDMETATGDRLLEMGAELDVISSVIFEDAPKFEQVGVRGVRAWSQMSANLPDKPALGNSENRQEAIFDSFGDQIQAVVRAGTPGAATDPRLYQVQSQFRAASGLNEGIPSDGGFLVSSEFSNQILANVWSENEVLKRCQKYGIGGNANAMKIPGFDESSRATGSRYGGVRSYWIGEADAYTATKPKFRMIELNLNKLIGLAYVTDELIEDSQALSIYMQKAFKGELDFRIQDAILNGTGAGQPLGILTSGAVVSVGKETGQAADTIVFENVNKMWSRLMASSRANAVWIINQDCEPQLHQMSMAVGTGGVPVYMPAGGSSKSPFNTLFGRPVIPIEQCPTVGTSGDIMLCDFSQYIAIDKSAKFDASIHVRFLFGEETLRFTYRFDGQPVLSTPITPFSSGDTLSHFVKLDAR